MTVAEAKETLLEIGPKCGHEPVDMADMSRLGLATGTLVVENERLEAEVASLRELVAAGQTFVREVAASLDPPEPVVEVVEFSGIKCTTCGGTWVHTTGCRDEWT